MDPGHLPIRTDGWPTRNETTGGGCNGTPPGRSVHGWSQPFPVLCFVTKTRGGTDAKKLLGRSGVFLASFGNEFSGNGSAWRRHGDGTIQRSTFFPGVNQMVSLIVVHAPDFEVDADVRVEGQVPGHRVRVAVRLG